MEKEFTPALGFAALSPLYDWAILRLTREHIWRHEFVNQISAQPSDSIIDVGSGTGSLAVDLLQRSPKTSYIGIDPDADIVKRAQIKADKAEICAQFETGFFSADLLANKSVNKIISSLVFHQVPLDEKQRIIDLAYEKLPKNGEIHIADYGLQKSLLMKFLFRITVQLIDGVRDTTPNAQGILPVLLAKAGFMDIRETRRIPTLTGTICMYMARKP